MDTPPASPGTDEVVEVVGRQVGRGFGCIFGVVFAAVFVVLWIYILAAVLTDSQLLADTWAWLSSLGPIETIVVWLAILPIAVFVWAWQADLSPLVMGLVILGMVAWTAVAFWGPLKGLTRRARRYTA